MTPVTGYTLISGYRLPSGAKLIYRHPDEDFCYGEFNLISIEYNCKELKKSKNAFTDLLPRITQVQPIRPIAGPEDLDEIR